MDNCVTCNKPSKTLYLSTRGLVCSPACATERERRTYPNWEADHALTEKRRENALKNFHHREVTEEVTHAE